MLAVMFSGRHNLTRDQEGRFFIDRDGTHFRHILNFLRDGTIVSRQESRHFDAILVECKFYGISGLPQAILEKAPEVPPCSMVRVVETRTSNPKMPGKVDVTLSLYTSSKESMLRILAAEVFSVPLMKRAHISDFRIPSACAKFQSTIDTSGSSLVDDVAVSHSMNISVFEALMDFGFHLNSTLQEGDPPFATATTYIFVADRSTLQDQPVW